MHIIQTLFDVYMHSKGEFELLETEKAVYETDFGEIAIEIPGKLTNSPDLMEHNAYNNDFFIFLYAFSEEMGGCELANSHEKESRHPPRESRIFGDSGAFGWLKDRGTY